MKVEGAGSRNYKAPVEKINKKVLQDSVTKLSEKGKTGESTKVGGQAGVLGVEDKFVDASKAPDTPPIGVTEPKDRESPTGERGESLPIPDNVYQALSPEEQQEINDIMAGKHGEIAKNDLQRIGQSEAFNNLEFQTQVHTIKTFLSHDESPLSNANLYNLINKDNFQNLTVNQQGMVLDIHQATDFRGQQYLQDLMDREINGNSALFDMDKNWDNLLENLHQLTVQEISPEFAENNISRDELITSILQEVSHPGEVNQGSWHGTCTVTSMQYMLCKNNPAEYVRLMSGLISPDGTVEMRNGDILKRDIGSIPFDGDTGRSVTERIFQSALMEYANGWLDYDTRVDRNLLPIPFVQIGYPGLNASQQERALEGIFGVDYDIISNKDQIIDELNQRADQDIYVAMLWNENKTDGHAVVITKIENGRVYFRNPWGPTADPAGTEYDNPPRILEDPSSRIVSMTVEDFKDWVMYIFVPADN